MSASEPKRVLFVCLGNICRSPTAHGVFLTTLARRGRLHTVEVDSCGTGNWHAGSAPDARAIAAAAERGYDLSELRARQVQSTDFAHYDYLLAMDNDNLQELLAQCPEQYANRVGLLLDYATRYDATEVPDPYYGGADGFSRVLDLIEDACEGLLQEIETTAADNR